MSTAYTIYTKPQCPNCDRTKEYFDSKGITYTPVDITEVPAALGVHHRRAGLLPGARCREQLR